jgi:hypothetical protein
MTARSILCLAAVLLFWPAYTAHADYFVPKNDIRRAISANNNLIQRFTRQLDEKTPADDLMAKKNLQDKITRLKAQNERLELSLYGALPQSTLYVARQVEVEEQPK